MLTSIGVTSFDGAQEGVLSGAIKWTFERCSDIGFSLPDSFRIANSIWLLITLAGVSGLYWLGVAGMHTVRGSPPVKELGRSFAHTLIPIALAYLVAHYFSAFLYQEQAQFTYILSDPLGHGSDLFGTAGGGINYGIVGSNTVWYVQVAALVVGHVTALTLAHDRALDGLRQRPPRLPLAVLHARGDGGLHLLRAVPALAGERLIRTTRSTSAAQEKGDVRSGLPGRGYALEVVEDRPERQRAPQKPTMARVSESVRRSATRGADHDPEDEDRQCPGQLGGGEVCERHRSRPTLASRFIATASVWPHPRPRGRLPHYWRSAGPSRPLVPVDPVRDPGAWSCWRRRCTRSAATPEDRENRPGRHLCDPEVSRG